MLKDCITKKYDRSIPNVDFDNEGMMWQFVSLIGDDKNIYNYIGLLLLRLGFEPEDNILLFNYNKDECLCDCTLNNEYYCKIKFDLPSNKIVIMRYNDIYVYECATLQVSEIGMSVSLGSYSYKYNDGLIFTRYLSTKNAKFVVSMNDFLIELDLQKPNDIQLPLFEHGIYAKYNLDNEYDLTNYLSSSSLFCKSIIDIYKELCKMYIGDVGKYPNFSLKKSILCEDGSLKVIDLVYLKYGELQKFGMTTYDRTLFLDKNDNWSYEMPREGTVPVNFLMSSQNGMVSCMFSAMEDYDLTTDYIHKLVKQDIDIAMNEVLNSKKRIKELFNERSDKNV